MVSFMLGISWWLNFISVDLKKSYSLLNSWYLIIIFKQFFLKIIIIILHLKNKFIFFQACLKTIVYKDLSWKKCDIICKAVDTTWRSRKDLHKR